MTDTGIEIQGLETPADVYATERMESDLTAAKRLLFLCCCRMKRHGDCDGTREIIEGWLKEEAED